MAVCESEAPSISDSGGSHEAQPSRDGNDEVSSHHR
uniref:Uncharacterized protein n=1 Tax=Parascaris univalens TaxID=6257 RepID=A0A914ZTS1_PARUN